MVRKLDGEKELKDIIQFKMGNIISRDSARQIYIIDKNDEQNDRNEAKVKNCEV